MLTLGFVVNVFQDDPNKLHQGQNQSPKSQRSHMVSKIKTIRWSAWSLTFDLGASLVRFSMMEGSGVVS